MIDEHVAGRPVVHRNPAVYRQILQEFRRKGDRGGQVNALPALEIPQRAGNFLFAVAVARQRYRLRVRHLKRDAAEAVVHSGALARNAFA